MLCLNTSVIHAKEPESLMIVAHPDDETIWGGSHLINGNYTVLCITNGNNKKTKKQLILPEGSCRKVFHKAPTVISAARRAADCVRYISCRKQGSHTSNWLAEETIQTLWKKIFGIFGEL